jgi:hypothetical protein
MSITELGALGEFIAAIAVLITLIYLALQIRQTQRAVSANTHQALNDISIHLYTTAVSSDSLANALSKSNMGEEELSSTELYQCTGFWTAMIRNAENMHYQYEMGLLEEERIRVSSEIIRRLMLRNQHFSRLWTSLESSLREKFVDWMESIFEESKSSRLQG